MRWESGQWVHMGRAGHLLHFGLFFDSESRPEILWYASLNIIVVTRLSYQHHPLPLFFPLNV